MLRTLYQFLIVAAVLVACILITTWLVGCAKADGGRTAREEKSVYREVKPDGTIIVDDSRNAGDTQQGSGFGLFAAPKIGETRGDELGAIEFKGLRAGLGNVFLGIFLFALAAVAWKWLANPMLAVALLSAGVLSFLFPVWLGVGAAVVGVGIVLYYMRKPIVEFVRGFEKAKSRVNGSADALKAAMAEEQDKTTKAVVAAVKGE